VQPVITGPPRGLADSKYAHLMPHYKRSDCALLIGPSDYSLGFLNETIIAEHGKLLLVDAESDPMPRRKPTVHVQLPVADVLEFLVEATASIKVRDEEWSRLWLSSPAPEPRPESHDGPVHPLEVAAQIRDALRPEDILVVDGGEFCQWIRLGLRDVKNRWLWNSKFGLIGNSIPMALGVSLHGHSGRTVAIMGDGGAGYHLLEFETAARYGIPFVAIVGNDARWSAEWHMQAARYGPSRTFDTDLTRARYDQAAAGLGTFGFHAPDAGALRRVLPEALSAGKPACINVEIQSLRSSSAPP
jgi:acetolactate synthase-1/2/3 large subunit